MPSDTYILTISDAGVSVPSSHASTHLTGGSDPIQTANATSSGLMSSAIYNQHVTNTAKVSNVTHTGDVTDAAGVLTVNKINGVSMAGLATGIVKNTTSTGAPSIAIAADFPTLNQNTTGTAGSAGNLTGGVAGAIPYQSAANTTAMLSAGTAGQVLQSNGSAAPSWTNVTLSGNLSGTLPVANGGTGATTLTGILKGNGTSAVTTVAAPTGALVGTTDTQTLTNKTFGNGTVVANLGTPISGNLSNCTGLSLTSGVTGALPATSGGTGLTSYTTGDLLYASTSSSVGKIGASPVGNVLLSKGFDTAPAYGKVNLTSHVESILPVANGGTGVTASTGSGSVVLSNSPAITSPTLTSPALGTPVSGNLAYCTGLPIGNSTIGVLPIISGGTGASASTGSGNTVLQNSPSLITPQLGTPSGGNLTSCIGLPLTTGTTGVLPVEKGGTGVVTKTGVSGSVVLSTEPVLVRPDLGTPSAGILANCTSLPIGNGTTGTLSVARGGTGATTLTGIIKGNGTDAFTTVTAPTGELVGTTDAQTLTDKTFGNNTALGTPISGNLSNCTSLPIGNGTTGTLSVARGGTGATTLTGIIKGNGTDAFTTVTAPTGALVGTTDAQTLTDKTFGNNTALGTPISGNLSNCTSLPIGNGTTGTLSVDRGGTGATTLTGIIKGNGTDAFTTVTAPTGALVGTTDTQTLDNKTFSTATFDTVAYKTANQTSDSLVTGEMRWNSTDKTLDLKLEGDVTLQIGQEQNIYVQNIDSSTIPNGAAVYIFGAATGDIPSVKLASSVNSLANKTLGIATQSISVGGYGYITLTGLVRGLTNASGLSTVGMNAGDEIWLSTGGTWSNTQQSFINSQIKIGHVVQVSSTAGSILVNPRIIAGPSGQRVGGIINSDSTSFLSASSGNHTLATYTVPATGWRNTGTIIHAKYHGRVTTDSSPGTRRLVLSVGSTTVFDSLVFTPVTTPTILYWHIEAIFSRVSNTELDVFVSLSGDGLNVASTHKYTQVTSLNLDSNTYAITLVGNTDNASSAKAIGYDFSTILWEPT